MAKKKHAIDAEKFRVKPGEKVGLKDWPTRIDPVYGSKEDYHALLTDHVARLSDLQQKLYARNRHALLLIFQAMDAAGKDGTIRHIMSGVNPQGCRVTSFKHPGGVELEHDFLWRVTRELPERGMIGIFNRSYYEERADPARSSGIAGGGRLRSVKSRRRILARALPLDRGP